MATPPYTLPQNNQPVTDPKTGIMTWSWYQFVRFLFQGTGSGVPLGTAATKAASNPVDAAVASVTTPITAGHIAQFADTNGTLKDGGGLGTGAAATVGTSGATVPLLNGNNTWSGTNTYTTGEIITPDLTNGAALLTLPATTDTLVGRATTDTLTNKTIGAANLSLGQITNTLGSDVLLNNVANYFDGPSVAQGSTGTWFASGQVVLIDTGGVAAFFAKLWDGTTVIASSYVEQALTGGGASVSLSGFLASPAGNLRISVRDTSSTSGKILSNATGAGADSTISAFRLH